MIQLIKAATLAESKEQRINAEATLVQLRLDKTDQFFIQIANVLQNQSVQNNIRQAAGTLVLMSTVLQVMPNNFLWDKLMPQTKNNVKDIVLSTLIDKDRNIRRAAANSVAAICCIEVPRGEWQGIVQKITANISNQDSLIKQVSILTLGFICQRLKQKGNFTFDVKLQEVVLSGILLGLKQSQKQIIETSLKALRDCIFTMQQLMGNQQYRDYMIKQIVSVVSTQQYRNLGLQILTEFAEKCYRHLGSYVTGFLGLLSPIMTNYNDEENCIQATEFWETVASSYRSQFEQNPKIPNYLSGQVGQKLVAILLQNLCLVNEDQQNQEDYIAQSSAKCLQQIFEYDSSSYQKLVLTFTQNTISHSDWKCRQASIKAFAIFLITTNQKRKQELLNASLFQLMSLVNDQSKNVQFSAIKSLELLTQECSDCFLHHEKFLQILQIIVSKLNISENFLRHVCKIIDNLAATSKDNQYLYFNNIADDLIKILFDSCLTANSSLATINSCILSIMNLIAAANNPEVSKKYIGFVIDNFGSIAKLQTEKREILYSSFFTLLQTCLIALRKQMVQNDILATIYSLIINHFTAIGRVDPDALYVVGTLSNFLRNDKRLIEDFWKYIEHSLSQHAESHIFKAVISCICDFAANYGPLLSDKIPILMPILLSCFQKSQVIRQTKLDLIMCMGELFLNCGRQCLPYLEQTMKLIFICCDAALKMSNADFNYAELLKENIIDTLTCILHGLNEQGNICQPLNQSMGHIFTFIKLSCDKQFRPKIDYVKNCVLFMADAAKFYKHDVYNLVRNGWVFECLQILKKHNKNGQMQSVINYAKSNF